MFLWGVGSISGTVQELCALLSVQRKTLMELALIELKRYRIATIDEQKGTNDEQNMTYTISCRKVLRTVAISYLRASAGKVSGVKRRTKLKQSSVYASSTASGNGEYEGKGDGFKEPTMDQVKLSFAKAGGSENDAELFFHHYSANGWKVGKNKMKSVSHAVSGWVCRNRVGTFRQRNQEPPTNCI